MTMKSSFHLLSALLVISLAACSPPSPSARPAPQVTVTHPETTTVTDWDEYPAHVEAVETVEIRPRVSGHIVSIHFQDGAEVKTGDLLFVIDPRPYQAELERTQAELHRAETHSELAKNDLKRAEGLRNTRAISEEEYDSRSKTAREAEDAVAAARAAENAARINLDYTHIKAPISGRIGRRLVTAGNFVQIQASGGAATVLATIVSIDPVYCTFDTDEAAFLKYRSGDAGNGLGQKGGSLACELALVNEQGYPHKGHVDFFDNQVNAMTGTIRLRAVFSNQDHALLPGMSANVRVPAGPPTPALLVPSVAVSSDQGNKFVLVLSKDSAAGSTNFFTTDIAGLEPIATRLKAPAPTDAISSYLKGQLSPASNDLLSKYTNGVDPKLQTALTTDLDRIIHHGPIFEARRFGTVKLSEETQELLRSNPKQPLLSRLNRLLIEDGYPEGLLKNRVVESRPITVGRQHGAMTAVLSGLTTQDRVVVNGLMLARPGSQVQVVDAAPQQASR